MGKNGFMSTLGIKQKFVVLIIAVSLLIMFISIFFAANSLKKNMLEANEKKASEITELVYSIVDKYKQAAENRTLTFAQAQAGALADVQAITYDGTNYVWITDYDTKMLSHPKLRGQDASQIKDPDGIRFFYEGTELAKSKGEGLLKYHWTKVGQPQNKFYPKISYFRNYPAWKWVIATGVYVDEVDNVVFKTLTQMILFDILATALIILVVLFSVVKDIVNSIENVAKDLEANSSEVSTASSQLDAAS